MPVARRTTKVFKHTRIRIMERGLKNMPRKGWRKGMPDKYGIYHGSGFAGRYYCSECNAFHSSYTKLGKSHREYEDVLLSINSFGYPMK